MRKPRCTRVVTETLGFRLCTLCSRTVTLKVDMDVYVKVMTWTSEKVGQIDLPSVKCHEVVEVDEVVLTEDKSIHYDQ